MNLQDIRTIFKTPRLSMDSRTKKVIEKAKVQNLRKQKTIDRIKQTCRSYLTIKKISELLDISIGYVRQLVISMEKDSMLISKEKHNGRGNRQKYYKSI